MEKEIIEKIYDGNNIALEFADFEQAVRKAELHIYEEIYLDLKRILNYKSNIEQSLNLDAYWVELSMKIHELQK